MSELNTIPQTFIDNVCAELQNSTAFEIRPSDNVDIKRGLRNADGTGVMAGCTKIGSVQGYAIIDGEKTPMEGRLIYRGYDIMQLISGFTREKRFGFEETAYLLMFGRLPTQAEYDALSQAEKQNGQLYFITDADSIPYMELTQTQYDALTYAEKHNGTLYFITDAS